MELVCILGPIKFILVIFPQEVQLGCMKVLEKYNLSKHTSAAYYQITAS